MSLIVKGTAIIFEMKSGDDIKPPRGYAMLHDPDGKAWPYRSVLVGPWRKGGKASDEELTIEMRKYLGRSHTIHKGGVNLPPRQGPWESLGEIAILFYKRTGSRVPPEKRKMRHEFGKTSVAKILLGHGKAHLSKCGSWYRVNLPRGAVVDDRGFVWP